jgi:hypothetical protein
VYHLDPALPRNAQQIWVSAHAEVPLEALILRVDGQPLARLNAPPYQALWRLAPGQHAFQAEGIAVTGETVTSEVRWVEVRE